MGIHGVHTGAAGSLACHQKWEFKAMPASSPSWSGMLPCSPHCLSCTLCFLNGQGLSTCYALPGFPPWPRDSLQLAPPLRSGLLPSCAVGCALLGPVALPGVSGCPWRRCLCLSTFSLDCGSYRGRQGVFPSQPVPGSTPLLLAARDVEQGEGRMEKWVDAVRTLGDGLCGNLSA